MSVFFCSQEVVQSLLRAGVPPRSKWGALILYMRSVTEYDFLSPEQKQQMQELVMDVVRDRDYSERRFKEVVRRKEQILYQPWNKKLEESFRETVQLIEQARSQNTMRTKEMRDLQETTISTVSAPNDLEFMVAEIRQSFTKVIAHMEQDAHDLVEMSYTDGLTKLNNRRAFDRYFQSTVSEYVRSGNPLCLLMLDIDHFKKFNDSYGHRIGDQALVTVAAKLLGYAHKYETAPGQFFFPARFGGEEFVVALPGVTLQEAQEDAEALRAIIEEYNFIIRDSRGQVVQKGIKITVSVGVAELDMAWGDEAAEHLLDDADKAMYQAKAAGRNRVCVMS